MRVAFAVGFALLAAGCAPDQPAPAATPRADAPPAPNVDGPAPPAPAADEAFPTDVRDRAEAATVRVANRTDGKDGSGAVIRRTAAEAFVLTAAHVLPDAGDVEVRFPGVRGRPAPRPVRAEVLARADGPDLALLRVPAAGAPDPLPLARRAVELAGPVVSVGWESGPRPAAVAERVGGSVRLRRPGADRAVLCWRAGQQMIEGRSGGPLVDAAGRVLGVASGHDGAAGYYVHADEVRALLAAHGLGWVLDGDR